MQQAGWSTVKCGSSRPMVLQQLLLLQEFNGAFQLDDALARVVGRPLSNLTAAADAFAATLHDAAVGEADTAWQTWRGDVRARFAVAVALEFLRSALSSRRAEWELVEQKSLKWLRKQAGGGGGVGGGGGGRRGGSTFGDQVCRVAAVTIRG